MMQLAACFGGKCIVSQHAEVVVEVVVLRQDDGGWNVEKKRAVVEAVSGVLSLGVVVCGDNEVRGVMGRREGGEAPCG